MNSEMSGILANDVPLEVRFSIKLQFYKEGLLALAQKKQHCKLENF